MEEENVTTAKETGAETAVDLGKFKSVDALKRAYGELEAEFTRRSQRLKELEERSKETDVPKDASAAPETAGSAQTVGQTEAPSLPVSGAAAESETLYRAVMENEGVRARVLHDYLQSLKGVPLLGGSGAGVTAPAVKPKSFAEAGNLALGYLKSKN